jgi:capsular exopolysaccharide synthesis family protein
MSIKNNTSSLDHPANGQSLVVRRSAPLEGRETQWEGMPMYSQAPTAATADAGVYLHALRRHWLVGIVLGIICAVVVGGLTWYFLPNDYTATALIRVSLRQERLVFDSKERPLQHDYEIYKNTQLQLLMSPFVLSAALRNPKIGSLEIVRTEEPDPITWLREELWVSFPSDAEIMQVSLSERNQVEVKELVNAIVDAYLVEIVQAEENQRRRRLTELDRVFADKENETRRKRASLKGLAEQLGTTDKDTLSVQQQIAVQHHGDFTRALFKQNFEYESLKGELQVAKAMLQRVDETPVSELDLQQLLQRDPIAKDLLKAMAGLRQVDAQQRSVAVEGSTLSSVDRFSQDLESIDEECSRRENELRELLRESKRAEIQEQISQLEAQVAVMGMHMDELKKEMDNQKEEIEEIGKSSVDVEMMRAELENLENVLTTIAEERESLKVELRSRSRINLVQSAQEPETIDNSKVRVSLVVLATIIGSILPLCGIVVLDVHKKRINSAEDVAKGLGLPVLGSVPVIPGHAIRRLNAPSKRPGQWNIRMADSIDSIAAKLLRNAAIEESRIVLITSAVAGEGKTTIATQVAMSLARAGRRTVLVDFDLRRPAIDKAFQLSLDPGVSEALCGQADALEAVQATSTDNLSVMTAGRCDRHALKALANGADERLFNELRTEFEFVVVDGSPILPVADTRFVSQHVDTVILAVFRDYSRAPKVTAACDILEAFGVHDIEAVVTSASEDEYGAA